MESYLSIVSLALAIAALVPVLVPSARVKLWTLSAAALSLIILLTLYQFFVEYRRSAAVSSAKADIVRLLEKRPMTFEQIYGGVYYRNFGVTNLAIDELVENGTVTHHQKEIADSDGRSYVIREFALQPPGSFAEAVAQKRLEYLRQQARKSKNK